MQWKSQKSVDLGFAAPLFQNSSMMHFIRLFWRRAPARILQKLYKLFDTDFQACYIRFNFVQNGNAYMTHAQGEQMSSSLKIFFIREGFMKLLHNLKGRYSLCRFSMIWKVHFYRGLVLKPISRCQTERIFRPWPTVGTAPSGNAFCTTPNFLHSWSRVKCAYVGKRQDWKASDKRDKNDFQIRNQNPIIQY